MYQWAVRLLIRTYTHQTNSGNWTCVPCVSVIKVRLYARPNGVPLHSAVILYTKRDSAAQNALTMREASSPHLMSCQKPPALQFSTQLSCKCFLIVNRGPAYLNHLLSLRLAGMIGARIPAHKVGHFMTGFSKFTAQRSTTDLSKKISQSADN